MSHSLPIPFMPRPGITQIDRAGAQQLTYENGIEGDWVFTLDGEELFKLPPYVTEQDIFNIRDVAKAMLERGYDEGQKYAETKAKASLQIIIDRGEEEKQLLKAENERLAEIIEITHGED